MQKLKFFIINLARSPERKAAMQEEIQNLKAKNPKECEHFEFEFFSAVDYKDEARFAGFDKFYNAFKTKFARGKELTAGERACWASHYSMWQKCLDSEMPIVVLEDDILFLDNFCVQILKIYEAFLQDCSVEYVRLYGIKKIKNQKPYKIENVVRISQNITGAQGYFLAPRAAQKFINHAKNWVYPVDDYMDMFFIHGVQILCCEPFIINEKDMPTSITDRAQKLNAFNKFTREICRFYLQLRKFLYFK